MYGEVFDVNTKESFSKVKNLALLLSRSGSAVLTIAISNVKGIPMLAAGGTTKAAPQSLAPTFAEPGQGVFR